MDIKKIISNLTPRQAILAILGVIACIITIVVATGSDKKNNDPEFTDSYPTYEEDDSDMFLNPTDEIEKYTEGEETSETPKVIAENSTNPANSTNLPNNTTDRDAATRPLQSSSEKQNATPTPNSTNVAKNTPLRDKTNHKQGSKLHSNNQTKQENSVNKDATASHSTKQIPTHPSSPKTNNNPQKSKTPAEIANNTKQQSPPTNKLAVDSNTSPPANSNNTPSAPEKPPVNLAFEKHTTDKPIAEIDDNGKLILPAQPSPSSRPKIKPSTSSKRNSNNNPQRTSLATQRNLHVLNQKMLTSLVDFKSKKGAISRSRYKVSVLEMDIYCDSQNIKRITRPKEGDTAYTTHAKAKSFLKWLTAEHHRANMLKPHLEYRLPLTDEIKTNKVWTLNTPSSGLKSFGFIKASKQ